MKSKLRKAWSLPASDWRLLARAWAWLLVIDVGLRSTSFKTLQARLQRAGPLPAASGEHVLQRISHVSRMVDLARRLHLVPMTCLRRSLALQRLLAAEGIPTVLRFGVRMADPAAPDATTAAPGLQAHAWLEYEGRPISEPEALVDRYAVLAADPAKKG